MSARNITSPKNPQAELAEQPWIDAWPLFGEARSKFPAPFDIKAARLRLARKFNARPQANDNEIRE